MAGRTKKLPMRIRETIDFIYELLNGHEWVEFSMSSIDHLTSIVCGYLIKRGIVKRRYAAGSKKSEYCWAAVMAPTKTLYDNIVEDYRVAKRAENMRRRDRRRKAAQTIPEPPAPEPAPVPGPPAVQEQIEIQNPLEAYADKELWDELKRRGWYIESDHLVRKEIIE